MLVTETTVSVKIESGETGIELVYVQDLITAPHCCEVTSHGR
jgi:hypothetical protein